jgi:hypothetical protein
MGPEELVEVLGSMRKKIEAYMEMGLREAMCVFISLNGYYGYV